MKLIIAGGRNYKLTSHDFAKLDKIDDITEIVSGGCSGADKSGELYAKSISVPVSYFPAEWDKHGKAAGPIRNKQMAEYADAVALFKGNKGTTSMFLQAQKAEIKIYDFRQ